MSDEKQAANPSFSRGMRVLVVNVRPVQARLVVEQLSGWGAAGEMASDVNQALIQLQDAAAVGKAYRVAIVDLPIGVFGAVEFGQIISNSVGARRTRYILSTSPDQALSPRQLANSVFCASIVKPITQVKLADALAVALSESGGKAPAPRSAERVIETSLHSPVDASELVKCCDENVTSLAGMLDAFQSQAIGDVERMIQGLQSRDAAQVARSAHALKNAATSLSVNGVRDAAARIERLGSAADFDAAHWAVQRLQAELEHLRDFVRDQARSGKV